jgi:hypothetical protein
MGAGLSVMALDSQPQARNCIGFANAGEILVVPLVPAPQ